MNENIECEILCQNGALYQFWKDDKLFYQKNCCSFTNRIIREKRILEFDTPNRVKVTYEYDVDSEENVDKTGEYEEEMVFLFLPDKRKSWLKVFFNGKRLTIPSSEKIREKLFDIVKKDITLLKEKLGLEQEESELWADIWKKKGSIPCFVYADDSLSKTGIAEITFYDFLKPDDSSKSRWPFDEKYYKYSYPIIAKGNSWLYVKSPNRFDIDISYTTREVEKNPENDPEICSFIIKGLENTDEVCFSIAVKVPETLKLWYTSLVVLGLLFILAFIAVSVIGIVKELNMNQFSPVYAQVGISIIAAIIATRGWLMNEETVLGRVSKWITGIVIFIIILLLGVYTYFLLNLA